MFRPGLAHLFCKGLAASERQGTEYIAGDPSSLWSFFKTAEFWDGDILVKPVLILDQFEELFTLQSPEARMNFLSELGYLVRGVAPPNFAETHPELSDAAPAVHVVLSLREDFLGLLEEAADTAFRRSWIIDSASPLYHCTRPQRR